MITVITREKLKIDRERDRIDDLLRSANKYAREGRKRNTLRTLRNIRQKYKKLWDSFGKSEYENEIRAYGTEMARETAEIRKELDYRRQKR